MLDQMNVVIFNLVKLSLTENTHIYWQDFKGRFEKGLIIWALVSYNGIPDMLYCNSPGLECDFTKAAL
eukprot:10857628-Karenia_brevis.AAC.1